MCLPNPRLTPDQLLDANRLLDDIRAKIQAVAGDDRELLFALRRKVAKELIYDERSKPAARKKLKALMRKKQNGKCAACPNPLPARGAVLDRKTAIGGYVEENVELVCPSCDAGRQGERGYR